MSFPSYILFDATFHQHRQAFWYVLMDLADPTDPCEDAATAATEAYYEIYSDY